MQFRSKTMSAICAGMALMAVGCSRSDEQKARERAEEVRREARAAAAQAASDAKRLGRDAQRQANDLQRDIDHSIANRNGSEGAEAKLESAAILAKVKARLAADAGLSTLAHVEVETEGSVVTLRGSVASEEEKRQVERAVARMPEVSRVVNDLKVSP